MIIPFLSISLETPFLIDRYPEIFHFAQAQCRDLSVLSHNVYTQFIVERRDV